MKEELSEDTLCCILESDLKEVYIKYIYTYTPINIYIYIHTDTYIICVECVYVCKCAYLQNCA